jgi:hypothetical protein
MELARSVCVLNALNPSELLRMRCNDPVQRKIDFGDGDPRDPHSQRLDGVRRKPRRSRQRMMFLQPLEQRSAGPSPASITRAVRASCGAHGSVLRSVRRAFDLSCWIVRNSPARAVASTASRCRSHPETAEMETAGTDQPGRTSPRRLSVGASAYGLLTSCFRCARATRRSSRT